MERSNIELLTRFCKAHPHFFKEPWFEFGFIQKTKSGEPYKVKVITTFVDKGLVNWRGTEQHEYPEDMADDECCKDLLTGMMENKSFLEYFKMMKFDSLNELDLKLDILGY